MVDSKKLHKYDGAFYSKMSMNVDGGEKGNGVLNIQAENEGLDTELHLTISVGGVHGQGRVRDLILQADTALYEAKIKKDCVVVYEEDANEAE